MYPENLSVAEVLNTAENRRADISGEWIYSNGAISMREKTEDELTWLAEQKKNKLITKAKDIIAPSQDAIDLGIATTEEESRLLAWKKYRVSLSRIDTTNHAGINWPKEPDNDS
ncbi:tail fiber assembly protein [Citrobacter sedlakii]|uniref:tail fiber assembly protein n=1 Tax=Citrobacter sedlakii TaxID=67826 RepID=UPI0022B409E7|nr:tail fiber assembly protein [Citrobacter sedlakii]MCZ4676009.1 tail fiber assembly protein [Citrobacter sedlakii]MDR5006066.1 tail fiber assembly protein [Citrobacter sedlakii]